MAERNEEELGRGRKQEVIVNKCRMTRRPGLVNGILIVNALVGSKYDAAGNLGSPTHAQ